MRRELLPSPILLFGWRGWFGLPISIDGRVLSSSSASSTLHELAVCALPYQTGKVHPPPTFLGGGGLRMRLPHHPSPTPCLRVRIQPVLFFFSFFICFLSSHFLSPSPFPSLFCSFGLTETWLTNPSSTVSIRPVPPTRTCTATHNCVIMNVTSIMSMVGLRLPCVAGICEPTLISTDLPYCSNAGTPPGSVEVCEVDCHAWPEPVTFQPYCPGFVCMTTSSAMHVGGSWEIMGLEVDLDENTETRSWRSFPPCAVGMLATLPSDMLKLFRHAFHFNLHRRGWNENHPTLGPKGISPLCPCPSFPWPCPFLPLLPKTSPSLPPIDSYIFLKRRVVTANLRPLR
jgi:hypothetical protein